MEWVADIRVSRDVARLEEKLDSMAAAFTAQTPLSLSTQLSPEGRTRDLNCLLGDDLLPSSTEAQILLTTFQTELSPYFPFIAIPMGTSMAELQTTKPFLFSTIVMVSCVTDADRQLATTQKIREYIGTSIISRGERSLDLLQGLLVCLAWYHFQLDLGSQFLGFLHLALAIVTDLGLTRKSGVIRMVSLHGSRIDPSRQQDGDRMLEERRAYLGCFYISHVASLFTDEMDPMRYTSYTEECCRVLESVGGSTDLYLIRLVRLHQMAERISRMLSLEEYAIRGSCSTPLSTRIETLETELRRMKQALPPHNLHDSILQLHYLGLEIKLYSISLEDDFPRHDSNPSIRFDLLSSCLNATKVFLDLFSDIPARNYLNLPYPAYAVCCFVLGMLSNLLLFTGERWDTGYGRSTLDLGGVIDTIVAQIDDASRNRHGQHLYQFPATLVKIIPRLRAIEEAHTAKRAAQIETTIQRHARVGPDPADDDPRDLMFPLPHGFSWRFLQS
ncbi:hypothetical protein BJX63DRAFT_432493 [Aspergillus granulosus]|uniref:Transcription factor domain-containing protein n=1 Tax=Aspergillus granulosus TaxID=176169 RepID=A0ABR4HAU8_9EURO